MGSSWTSGSVSGGEVSSLDQEVFDDSVELGPLVAVTFLQRHGALMTTGRDV